MLSLQFLSSFRLSSARRTPGTVCAIRFALLLALPAPVSAAQVALTWRDNAANETGFKVERATGSGSFSQIGTAGRNAPSYTDSGAAASTAYRYRVRAYNSAGNSSYSNAISVTTGSSTNTAPTISAIADRTIAVNGTTGSIAFTIGDAQTSAASLTLIRNASNLSLVPLSGITFGGSGANRTVTVRPASNKTGWSTIWVKVSDGQLTRTISFMLTVVGTGGNTPPTITAISNRTISVNGSTGPIAFTIGDAQTSASNLTLTKNTSNLSLIPPANITLGGSGANRTVTVRPASNRTGWSTVWIKVSDGSLASYIGFVVSIESNSTTSALSAASSELPPLHQSTELSGDAELTVQVTSLNGTDDQTRAGLMFRASSAAETPCAGVYITGASRLLFVWRTAAGEALQTRAPLTGTVPQWLRLTRVGDAVYGFASADGVTWDLIEFETVNLPDTAQAGTVVTAPGGANDATATFAHASVN